jgi:hypothetical protein
MKRTLLTSILLIAVAFPVLAEEAADLNNPLQFAKEGDTVEYQVVTQAETPVGEATQRVMTSRLSVVEIDRQLIKLAISGNNGKPSQTVSLTSRGTLNDLLTGSYQDVEISSNSVERGTVDLNGKTYDCRIVRIQFTGKTLQSGMTIPVKVNQTVWYCQDIPVHGQVKSVTDLEMTILGDKTVRYQTKTTLTNYNSGS